MNFTEARETLERGRNPERRKIYNNTTLERLEDSDGNFYLGLRLHDTVIIKYYPERMILDSGGWRTVTTKARFSAYAPNVGVSARQGEWFINGELFYDGIELDYDGNFLSDTISESDIKTKAKEVRRVKRVIKKYAKAFVVEWQKDDFPLSSNADCWYCLWKKSDDTALGDHWNDTVHLLSHIEESYFVPSLLMNALIEQGYNDPALIYQLKYLDDNVYRALYRYLVKRLIPDIQV